ncbi:MAG TPA: hypothetical protein VF677_11765 [Flavobacterium sp.]
MKKMICIAAIIIVTGCKTAVTTVPSVVNVNPIVKLTPTEVDAAEKSRVYELGKRVLNSCKTSKFKRYTTSEATPEVIGNITPEKISRTCQKFRLKYGDFKDIELVEVIQDNNAKTKIYRYKAKYQRDFVTKELRVTLNDENKISGIKSTDWTD